MATIKLKDYLLSLSSKGSSANNDKITILDSADGNKIKSILKSDLVDLTYIVEELRDDFLDTLGDNVISSSAQVNADTITNFDTNVKAKINSDGVLSGSSQVTLGGFDTDNLSEGSSNLYYTNVRVKTKLNAESVISSSAQIDGEFLNTTGDDVVSSSIQITITDTTGFTTLSSSLQSTDNAIAARVTAVESFSSSLDSTYASDSELTAVSSAFDSTINSLNTADVSEDSSNKYYTDVRVKTKLTAEDVVSGSNSQVKTFLGISASDISDVEAFSQSGTYSGLRAQSTTAADVDLGNVTNESKATMFTSPAFTTNPTAPTQTGTDDSTKLATTEFVQARITDIIGNAGSTLDTLGELSASLAEDSGSLSTLTTTVGTKLAKASNLSDLQDASTARTNLGVDAAGTVNYVLPTDLAGDDIDIDTTPLTGATVISDLDINITTNTSGLVTDANGTVATRTLTATDLSLGNVTNESKATMFTSPTFTGTVGGVTAAHVGLGSSDDVTFNTITGSKLELDDGTGGIVIETGLPTGYRFVGIGYRVGYGLVNTAPGNTGLGYQTLGGLGTINAGSGHSNTAVGSWALTKIVDGHDNIGIGKSSAIELTNGSYNTVVGRQAASSLTTGNMNIIIGDQSGNGVLGSGTALIDGSGNTILGSYSGFQNSDDYNSIVIGSGSVGNGSNTVVIGNGSITSTELKGNVSFTGSLKISGDGTNGATFTESGNGDFDIVSVDDLRLTAGGNDIVLKGNSGNEYGRLSNDSQNLIIKNITSDKDISFVGKDDATDITALTLDMSNGGSATFIDDIDLGGKLTQTGTGDNKFSGTVKISKDSAGLQQNLLLSNLNDTDGDATGIAFSMLDNNTFVKGGLYFERTTTQGRGDLVFLNNNEVNGNNASLTDADARMKITPAGEVRIGNEYTVNANGLSIEKTGNHIFLRATSATAGEYWNFDVTSNNELGILQDNGDGISIKDTGVLQTPNGIVLNSNTVTGNKTSVTLNNYEEGTWTPLIDGSTSVTGQTYSRQEGSYIRIGNMVTAWFSITLSAKGTIVGFLRISGLPYNGTATPFLKPAAVAWSDMSLTAGHQLSAQQYEANPFMYLFEMDVSGAQTQLQTANINNNTDINGTLTYMIA
ncbi:hypothetical protein N9I13_00140 [bacterium]|nr:hypothetical protein [bacterium]